MLLQKLSNVMTTGGVHFNFWWFYVARFEGVYSAIAHIILIQLFASVVYDG